MKALKIGLIVLVLLVIAVLVYLGIDNTATGPVTEPAAPSDNEYVKKADNKIDSLSHYPETKFCKDFYTEIEQDILVYKKDNKISEKQKDDLLKNLNYTYFSKFIDQSFNIFNGSVWDAAKLNFISNETKRLQKSSYIEKGGDVSKKLDEIQSILNKYYEIRNFVNRANSFTGNESFNLSTAKSLAISAREYRSNMGNKYLNNTSLKDDLNRIPEKIYQKHLSFLRNRVNQNCNKYADFSSYNAYKNREMYKVVNDDLYSFIESSSAYGVTRSKAENDRESIKKKWDQDIISAFRYKYK